MGDSMSEAVMFDDAAMNVGMDVPTVAFSARKQFGHFVEEHAVRDETDLVFHFFQLPSGPLSNSRQFWLSIFPQVLSDVAQAAFNSSYPRLVAQHVVLGEDSKEPLDSWYMCARGFALLPLAEDLTQFFLERLDLELQAQLQVQTPR